MSQVLISQYLNNLSDLKKLGYHRESVVRDDCEEKVIDLLLRVTTVSVRAVEITKAMERAARS